MRGVWTRGAVFVVAAVALAATVAAAPRHATAPPAGVTGGFGEPTCAFCHIGNDVNAFGGHVRIEGLPGAYEPGAEYVLTVDVRADETAVAGFQLAARFDAGERRGRSAGTLAPVDARTAVVDSLGVAYVHQTEAGSVTDDPAGGRWTVSWTAPERGGSVAFHVAANSGNADNSPLGDLVYAASRTVTMASSPPRPHRRAP